MISFWDLRKCVPPLHPKNSVECRLGNCDNFLHRICTQEVGAVIEHPFLVVIVQQLVFEKLYYQQNSL